MPAVRSCSVRDCCRLLQICGRCDLRSVYTWLRLSLHFLKCFCVSAVFYAVIRSPHCVACRRPPVCAAELLTFSAGNRKQRWMNTIVFIFIGWILMWHNVYNFTCLFSHHMIHTNCVVLEMKAIYSLILLIICQRFLWDILLIANFHNCVVYRMSLMKKTIFNCLFLCAKKTWHIKIG